MLIGKNPKKNKKLADDLTVVLLRGNGTPRSFQLSIPYLQRSAITLGITVAGLATLLFAASLYIGLGRAPKINIQNPAALITTAVTSPENTEETKGLREDLAKLQAQLDGRKPLTPNTPDTTPLRLIGPTGTLVADGETSVKVMNSNVKRGPNGSVTLDFELHNTHPQQRQERGYILALAKSKDFLAVYPQGAFSPSENVVLTYSKGETFAISRFRMASAEFKNLPQTGAPLQFQILLFNTVGKIIATMHVEENR